MLVFTRVYVHSVAHSAHFGTVFGTVESGIDRQDGPAVMKGSVFDVGSRNVEASTL